MGRPENKPRGLNRLLVGVVCLALVGGAIAAWYGGVRNYFLPMNFGIVEPGRIYRSGQISRRIMHQTLERYAIATVIDLSGHENTPDAQAERQVAAEMGVERDEFPLRGNGLGDPQMYVGAIATMVRSQREGKPVLVHCQSGAQRTSGVVAVYRILVEGRKPEQAFEEMLEYGHRPSSNPKLIPFLRAHLGEWEKQLTELGAIKPLASSTSQPGSTAAAD